MDHPATGPKRRAAGHTRRLAWLCVVQPVLLIWLSLCGSALPLDVDVGLGGAFVPGFPTPVSVSVEPQGMSLSGAEWVLEQQIGDPWRGEATMQYRFPADYWELQTVVPLYDFTYPLSVTLLGSDDGAPPLAEVTLSLRSLRVSEPYSLVIGSWPRIERLLGEDGRVADVAVVDLPDQWWAYVGISTVWLGTAPTAIQGTVWEAIERWVLSGGRLVLTTGTSFYLVDSPELRRLLPITSPVLVERRLQGDPKHGAVVWDWGPGPDPDPDPGVDPDSQPNTEAGTSSSSRSAEPSAGLSDEAMGTATAVTIVSREYGAGRVIFVDQRADELPDRLVADLLGMLDEDPYLAATTWLSGVGNLRGMGLQRPGYPTTIGISLVLVGGLLWSVFWRRLCGWKRLLGLGVVLAILLVWSGLHVNVRNQASAVYAERTILHLIDKVGIRIDRTELFASSTSSSTIPANWLEGELERGRSAGVEGVAVGLFPRELSEPGQDWDTTWIAARGDGLVVDADRGQQRDMVFLSDSDAVDSVEVVYTGDERLRVNNPGEAMPWAIAVVDGESYDLGGLSAGESAIQLERAVLPGQSVWGVSYGQIGAELESRFALSEGAWLIAGTRGLTNEPWGQAAAKVRQTEVYVIVADRAD